MAEDKKKKGPWDQYIYQGNFIYKLSKEPPVFTTDGLPENFALFKTRLEELAFKTIKEHLSKQGKCTWCDGTGFDDQPFIGSILAPCQRCDGLGLEPECCELCGEPITGNKAEMYDPSDQSKESVICHPECGLSEGYDIA